MVYFKFPFDEQLYSTDEDPNENHISFHPFNGSEGVRCPGKLVQVNTGTLNSIPDLFQPLPEEEQEYREETQEEYIENVHQFIRLIKENNLPKLVYSRRKIVGGFSEIDLHASFINLCQAYPNAFRYIFNNGGHSWMGAFSEVLGKFNKSTHEFETMSLAGTLPVSEEWTEKEIEEQKPVSVYIKNILDRYSNEVSISATYDHISGNIKHLRTDFKARIKPEDLDRIIADLHPTPAVCGIPKDFCKEQIERTEKYPRELYAGYIRIEIGETVQYYVNLRCAKLFKDSVHLFVGGGITSQSSPEKEWRETELKSEAILKNLILLS
ncbi:chorismate-binding protein [Chryseobacterium camelliae]|uniref:chorismate-binding protein n=1 Tax=Chryseobacterium camelliae TaxID=1265445 RepID=UPI0028573FBF|nr:chorismate-binding protein [Chryseobacterium camelliae]MDR6515737.1 isochorismate synthase [Chryseobacterium camelliae]